MGKPEEEIENYLGKLCKQNDFLYYKFVSPQHLGVPDRILIGHNQTVFVELKRPHAKPRLSQVVRFNEMRRHGGKVYVVSTKNEAEQLIKKLLPHDYQPNVISKKPKSNKFTIFSIESR